MHSGYGKLENDSKELYCPSMDGVRDKYDKAYTYGGRYGTVSGTLGVSPLYFNLTVASQKASPSTVAFLMDCGVKKTDAKPKVTPYYRLLNDATTESSTYSRPYVAHSQRCNMVFADLHVGSHTKYELKDLYLTYNTTSGGKVTTNVQAIAAFIEPGGTAYQTTASLQ